MFDMGARAPERERPFGIFVHHQGEGHARRVADLVSALPVHRRIALFSARPPQLKELSNRAEIIEIPSLFERDGREIDLDCDTPDTLHCAPVGWPGIRRAGAVVTSWLDRYDPALFISDVSAEMIQLARLCSVPTVAVIQHGDRSDPGHRGAYRSSAGLLAPFAPHLAQDDWPEWQLARTKFAAGIGTENTLPDRQSSRARLGMADTDQVILVVSGKGGGGLSAASIGIGARALPRAKWHVIGPMDRDWHATLGPNVSDHGWVDNPGLFFAASDMIVSSAGNTTCSMALAAQKPWVVIPEWRYFDEQLFKAKSLAKAGAAHFQDRPPATVQSWRIALSTACAVHDPQRQSCLIDADPARSAADWLEQLSADLWASQGQETRRESA